MRILLVSATPQEIAGVVAQLPRLAVTHEIETCVTGVGMVPTAVRCTQALLRARYDLAIDLGVCGSFDPALPPGSVVHVVREALSEVGAEDGEGFLSLDAMRLAGADEFPFAGGWLVNREPPANPALAALPTARGITVNTVHGRDASIAEVAGRLAPQVESMEGAAFMYACLVAGVPFAEVRAVSNVVERRNRAAWKMGEAVGHLTRVAIDILERA